MSDCHNCDDPHWQVSEHGEPPPPLPEGHDHPQHGTWQVSEHPEDYGPYEDYVPDTEYTPVIEECVVEGDYHTVVDKTSAMIIEPCIAPTLEEIRAYGFEDTLVSIEDDVVIENICQPPVCEVEPECCEPAPAPFQCTKPEPVESFKSCGSQLEQKWLDALPVRAMTLIGRVGRKLAKLRGEGWLYLNDRGEVSASRSIPLKVTKLWHKFFAPSGGTKPYVGPPMEVPYLTVTDHDGNVYAVKGLPGQESVMMWNPDGCVWEPKTIGEVPWCVKEHLQGGQGLEIVGFSPVAPGDDIATVRCPKRLVGTGMIYFEEIPSGLDYDCECAPQPTTTTVARFIPNPTENPSCPPVLVFMNGVPQWVNASLIECLRGPQGVPGEAGVGQVGPQGPQGAPGVTNYQNACGNDPCR